MFCPPARVSISRPGRRSPPASHPSFSIPRQHSPSTVDLGATDLSLVIADDQLRPPHLQHSEPGGDLLSRRPRSPRTSSSKRAAGHIVGGQNSISPAARSISLRRRRSRGSTTVATDSPPPAVPASPPASDSPRQSPRSRRPSCRGGSRSRPTDLALRPPRRSIPTPMSLSEDTAPALAMSPLTLGVDRPHA